MIGFIACYLIGGIIGTVIYFIYRGGKAIVSGPEPLQECERVAGRIHLFDGDRYYNSTTTNAYEHPSLNWADGRIGCGSAIDLQAQPEIQPALIGTIQIYKPEQFRGHVAVIVDNEKIKAMGLIPFGLNSGAQELVDRIVPTQTLRSL